MYSIHQKCLKSLVVCSWDDGAKFNITKQHSILFTYVYTILNSEVNSAEYRT